MVKTQNRRNFWQRLRAFTITELVIVIAVIAVLMAVLIPTFSSIVSNSKKSHDEQYVRELNTAIANYTATNNSRAPESYEDLMLYALQPAGLCDASNPFLLATKLKQKDVYLVWYPNSNSVELLNMGTGEYTMNFVTEYGDYGNAVAIYQAGTALGSAYLLCNTGNADSVVAANLYLMVYSSGDISKFLSSSGSTLSSLKDNMNNQSWANSIIASINNQSAGYAYSNTIMTEITKQLASSSSANVNIAEMYAGSTTTSYSNLTETQQTAVKQATLSTLATLSASAKDSSKASALNGKSVKITVPEGTEVDMAEVTVSAIGTAYRKDAGVTSGAETFSVSVDFGDVTLKNMTVEANTFVSSGSSYQDTKDCTVEGGAYMFTYGIFGSVIAAPGKTVTYSNLNIEGVNMVLTGASEDVNGTTQNTLTDMAGIIAGYTQGDVVLSNIHIDGGSSSSYGTFSGFDAVGGLVGRASQTINSSGKKLDTTLKIENCSISNMNILGVRRAAGFVGFSAGVPITMKGCSLTNVNIEAFRSIEYVAKDQTASWYNDSIQRWAALITDTSAAVDVTVDGLVLTDVSVDAKIQTSTNSQVKSIVDCTSGDSGALYKTLYGVDRYIYVTQNGANYYLYSASNKDSQLKITGNGITLNGAKIATGSYTRESLPTLG